MNVEPRIGRAFALETDDPPVEAEDAPGEIVIPLNEIGATGEARLVGEAANLQVGGPAAVDAKTGDLELTARELQVELPRMQCGGVAHPLPRQGGLAHGGLRNGGRRG